MNPRISVIGAGAWGTALAALWSGAGRDVTLVARNPDQVADMQGLLLKSSDFDLYVGANLHDISFEI